MSGIQNYKGDKYKSMGIDLNNFDVNAAVKRFDNVSVTGINVLILIYKPYIAEKTLSGIYLTQQQQDSQQEYNSMVGLVLKTGPDAFTGKSFPSGAYTKPGDWVVFPRSSSLQVKYEDEPLIMVEDFKIKLLVDDPSKISR